MERNDRKFTIGKYHMNKMEIIKLLQVNIIMSVTTFPCVTIWLFCKRRPFRIFGQFREGGVKENNRKNCRFCVEKERQREKNEWLKGYKKA